MRSLALAAVAVLTIGVGLLSAQLLTIRIRIPLSGLQEVPQNAHGNDDRGRAKVTIPSEEEICFQFPRLRLLEGEPLPHMAHIHVGVVGVAGPIVLHIFGSGDAGPAPTSYPTETICRPADPELVTAILETPTDYYVNLHNATHPAGVVRGQLPDRGFRLQLELGRDR